MEQTAGNRQANLADIPMSLYASRCSIVYVQTRRRGKQPVTLSDCTVGALRLKQFNFENQPEGIVFR